MSVHGWVATLLETRLLQCLLPDIRTGGFVSRSLLTATVSGFVMIVNNSEPSVLHRVSFRSVLMECFQLVDAMHLEIERMFIILLINFSNSMKLWNPLFKNYSWKKGFYWRFSALQFLATRLSSGFEIKSCNQKYTNNRNRTNKF